ncbi:hypothetical protein F4818DRAFT_80128 [Hypoxylon cercidicola]|nr:hypothetical protein F4818DRAFT_80128 [Hypoxylon cercidicola]
MRTITIFLAAVVLQLALADPIPQPSRGTAPLAPADIVIPARTVSSIHGTNKQELSICYCCVSEPQPELDHYIAECPRKGVEAVCGNEPAGDPEYSLGGFEGQPEEIAKVCSSIRCGPVKFMD